MANVFIGKELYDYILEIVKRIYLNVHINMPNK